MECHRLPTKKWWLPSMRKDDAKHRAIGLDELCLTVARRNCQVLYCNGKSRKPRSLWNQEVEGDWPQ
eukprot:s3463_g8.t1